MGDHEQFHARDEFDNLDEMEKLFELTNGQIGDLNSLLSIRKIKFVTINLPSNKTTGKDGFTGKFYLNLSNSIKIKTLHKLLYEASKMLTQKTDQDIIF